jgi:hypothetical protein
MEISQIATSAQSGNRKQLTKCNTNGVLGAVAIGQNISDVQAISNGP